MKKLLTIILGAMFVMSFAVSAFAIHAEIPAETTAIVAKGATQITLGGEIRTRGWWRDNLSGGLGKETLSQAWYDQRVRLSVDANVAPGVTGFVQIETHGAASGDKYVFGTAGTSGGANVANGAPSTAAGGTNAKPNAYFDVLQAWILYQGTGLFGFNSGLKVGHMPLKLAYGQFFDNTQYGDDAVVFFIDPTKELHVGLLTFKGVEGVTANGLDDLDAYVALATYKLDANTKLGANYTFINKDDLNLSLQNLGLHADGKVAGFGYEAAADLQFGKLGAAKFKGYAFSLKANYNMDPANLRASVIYGSGDNNSTDSSLKEFVAFNGNIQDYSFIYEYMHRTTALNGSTLNGASPSDGHAAGVANTTYFNVGADYKAMKDLSLSADFFIFRATKVPAGSKNAGWEVDAKAKYALAKNLSYQVDAGYFKPGQFYTDQGLIAAGARKAVTQLRHAITLSF